MATSSNAADIDMTLSFHLNGDRVDLPSVHPTMTLLDWLRDRRGLTGTKEGCNEGDCGACTVMVADGKGARAVNACILFMPQLQGKAVVTVEGLAAADGTLHPVQQAMVEHHGSQCGFCTPGIVMSLATAHVAGRTSHDDTLAGNLCRCTGYAPIVRAADAAFALPVPAGLRPKLALPNAPATEIAAEAESWKGDAPGAYLPESADQLAAWLHKNPKGTIVGGATDLGLHVTKQMRKLGPTAFLHRCRDLQQIEIGPEEMAIGAAVTIADLAEAMAGLHPSLAQMLRRYGSVQVRNAATIGGNIANASPIGDGPPALIALGATLVLRHGNARRDMPLEEFFLDYGKQDRKPGEFVEMIRVPRQADRLACYKLSKRFDQDISAVCGCFNVVVEDGVVTSARIAFGGMAGIPKRAANVEAALTGRPWNEAAVEAAWDAWARDFTPLSDMRASAAYRLEVARNMLTRYFLSDLGAETNLAEVMP